MSKRKNKRYEKILVPTDFSATAKCAMTYAQILAAEMEGGKLTSSICTCRNGCGEY
ncbi:MAG: hypothetical protein IPK21_20190 [Haliscomenobacter sp.]|nr:hypothetical protein [Haliscomenobacter sp.]